MSESFDPSRPSVAGASSSACVPWVALSIVLMALPATAARQADPPPLLPEATVSALAAELSGTNARHVVQELALHHRMRGSKGFRAAAEAIRERAASYGLAEVEILEIPADGEIYYGTQRSRPAWNAEFAELWELRQEGGAWVDHRLVASWRERPITLAQDSSSGAAEAELVDVGAGTSEADYEGKDVRGRLVLTSSQPGAVAELAVGERGAAGIVSYAQNQRSAWWGEDRNLVRWGHLETFAEVETFAFMVTVNQAEAWKARLGRGETVRLRARVEAGRQPGVYAIATGVIPGADPDLRAQEIVYSCHLDHQRPGANDNASGCAAILEAARALSKLVREGKIEPPRRTLRFIWPPEIEGTIALLNAHPDFAARARAAIHMDMVGGAADVTKAIFHVTRSPASLPTFVNDVAEAFGRFVNSQSYAYSATGAADTPLVDPEGSRQALQARFAPFSTGSDHQVWTDGSFRVPAVYLNDWPDRYIHTHADGIENIDATKLLRAAFLGAASGYYLARLDPAGVPALLGVVERQSLRRAAAALERRARLDGEEGSKLLEHFLAYERGVVASIDRLAPRDAAARGRSAAHLESLRSLVGAAEPVSRVDDSKICRRSLEPKGPLWAFGYSYFEDHLRRHELPRPGLLAYRGLWGDGSEYAYEVLNLIDGRRSIAEVRDAVAATYGPVPLELVEDYVDTLDALGVVRCPPPAGEGFAGPTGWTDAPTAPLARRAEGFPVPGDPVELGAAGYAKVLCSAVFVSGREPDEARRNSAFIFLAEPARNGIRDVDVDRVRREVTVRWSRDPESPGGEIVRTARYFGDQGCVTLPEGQDGVYFEPVEVRTALPGASTLAWPMGDLVGEKPPGPAVDVERLAAATDAAFADPEAYTAAFLVVHEGRILTERYALGVGRDTQLESWSMGKSLTATLVGVLAQQGALKLDGPAPIPAWSDPGDPRSQIRIIDLLRMSSGLHFVAPRDPDYDPLEHGYPDHMFIYTGDVDAFEYTLSRPRQFPPNTEGRYRNSDPLALGYLVREAVRARGEEYLNFPQRELFDRIGIRRQVLEVDPWGNFELTGYDYGTPRNWARLGLLYLQDGVWQGERLLPEGFTELVSTPAPAWSEPVYGGLFWLNRTGFFPALPEDAYYMAGAGGQWVIIVPSLDLVIVRMGHLRGLPRARAAVNRALEHLVAAIDGRDSP